MVWLDVLDLPLVYYMEASYHVTGQRQEQLPGHGDRAYTSGGLLPTPVFERDGSARAKPYPMLRYPWVQTRAALLALAKDRPDQKAVHLTYANPETRGHAENILGFYAMILRSGQALPLPVRLPAIVFHVIEVCVQVQVHGEQGNAAFPLAEADTCCAPGFTPVTLSNMATDAPAFVFIADETPLHQKLGVFEVRG